MRSKYIATLVALLLFPPIIQAVKVTDLDDVNAWAFWVWREATRPSSYRHLAVDDNSKIHITYINCEESGSSYIPRVWYRNSTNGGSSWSNAQQVASGDAVSYPSLDVDFGSGIPYIYTGNLIWKNGTSSTFDVFHDRNGGPLTINADDGYGMFHINTRICEGSGCHWISSPQLFELSTLNSPSGWKGIDYQHGVSSCSWSGDDCIGVSSILSKRLNRRVDYKPWELNIVDMWEEDKSDDENRFQVSTATFASQVWAVYGAGEENDKIRYKIAEPNEYEFFPSNNAGFLIADNIDKLDRLMVQIAKDYPVVVWSVNGSFSAYGCDDWYTWKMYYSYYDRTPGSLPHWTTPTRVTTSADYVMEGFPHIAVDLKEQKLYFLWTQRNNPNWRFPDEGISLHFTSLDASMIIDTILITRPMGGEKWFRGNTEKISWIRGTSNNPTNIHLQFSTNCYAENPTWTHINTLNSSTDPDNSTEEYDWPVGMGSDGKIWDGWKSNSCKIRIIVDYVVGQTTYRDTAYSGEFTIGEALVQTWGPNSSITGVGMMSSGYDDSGIDDIWFMRPLGFIEPADTFKIPWESWWFNGPDTAILQFSGDGGVTFTNAVGGLPSDSSIIDTSFSGNDTSFLWKFVDTLTWISPSDPTNGGCFRMMLVDTSSDTAYSSIVGPYYVITPGGFQYATYSNQGIMSLNDDGDDIGLIYTAQDDDTTTKLSVVYMESDEGLDFNTPDTIAEGAWPAFSGGACTWQNVPGDTIYYAYQTASGFSTPYTLAAVPDVDTSKFAPVGLVSEDDTTHVIFKSSWKKKDQEITSSRLSFVYAKFPESSPGSYTADTLKSRLDYNDSLYDTTKIAPTLVKHGSTIYGAFNWFDTCYLAAITSSGHVLYPIGYGSRPHVSCTEGNITYTYLGNGDSTIIRLWGYVGDTTWVETDTFYLDGDAEFFCGDRGVLFGVNYSDTSLTDVYGYSPLAETFLLQGYYTGYYAHPYVDDEADEFSWVSAYADLTDDSGYVFLHTVRRQLYVAIPAAYMEAKTRRSPFTLYRDTCITDSGVVVDSGADSLKYRIPCLDDGVDYTLMVEFYHYPDTLDTLFVLQINTEDSSGTSTDTFTLQWWGDASGPTDEDEEPNEVHMHTRDISSGTDTVTLTIKHLSGGYVPVKRVIVRRRAAEGVFTNPGGIEETKKPEDIPFCLYQPFPNPFGSNATIRFAVPYSTEVSLKVYDVSGRLVTDLVNGRVRPGVHELTWDGRDFADRKCGSGVYFVRFVTRDYTASKKMVMIK